jgi:Asp-tRNA(Asn)/Glu-tRNA(Gln) amidotransferase A subunit family amidase
VHVTAGPASSATAAGGAATNSLVAIGMHLDVDAVRGGEARRLCLESVGAPSAEDPVVTTCRALARAQGIDFVLRLHHLDAIVAPTGSPAWTTDLVNGDHFTGASSTPAAVAGYPSITVPAGYAFGLPVGISFIGTAWSEPKLIALAYAYEQATKHRVAPKFPAHASLER